MSTDLFTATQLIAVLTVFCAAFCPILCWVISGAQPKAVVHVTAD